MSDLDHLIRRTERAAQSCRVIRHTYGDYMDAREYVLDTAGALADWLEEKAIEISKED